jgi:hypothetical protein
MKRPSPLKLFHVSLDAPPACRRKASVVAAGLALASLAAIPVAASAATVANPICPAEKVLYDPGSGQDIVVPPGYNVTVFAAGLNFPTGIAFRATGGKDDDGGGGFEVYVQESGHGLPSSCNDEGTFQTMFPSAANPFTPDIKVFDSKGNLKRTISKPKDATACQSISDPSCAGALLPHGPSVDIAFENGLSGGRLFATDSNQATHAHNGQNNSSRIVVVDPTTGNVTPFIAGLPTGDHPTEQLAFKQGRLYWSQGSTTNSGVVGRDNGGGQNQPDIPCQNVTLSQNVFDSGGGVKSSGYSPFGVTQPGATVAAFTGSTYHGVCDGAILSAPLTGNPTTDIQPYSWGYRNGYALRFAPEDHILRGGLLVGMDGADERGARPSNNAPDELHLVQTHDPHAAPDYHGWPDRYGFYNTTQATYYPVGGPADDLCVGANNPPSNCTPASLAQILAEDVPMRDVLDHSATAATPKVITSPIAIETPDSSFTGIDFVPNAWTSNSVQRGAAAYILEGDFGFSASNSASDEVGHELRVINFLDQDSGQLTLSINRFAKNKNGDQAFIDGSHGWSRPTQVRFGPDGCAWVTDYGAVRDAGQSGSDTKFINPADALLVQIPGTGVVFRICRG